MVNSVQNNGISMKNELLLHLKKLQKIVLFAVLYVLSLSNVSIATTLKDAIQLAYKNSEQVYMKLAQKDITNIDFQTAIFNLLPQVEGSYTYMKQNKRNFHIGNDLQQMIGAYDPSRIMAGAGATGATGADGTPNASSEKKPGGQMASVTVTASLSYYKTIPMIIANKRNVDASAYEYNEFLENFGLLFVQKYMDVIYYSKAKEVYSQMKDTLEKKVKRVSILNKYGTAKKDKVVIAEAQYYENEANKINMQSALDKAKIDYKIMTGMEPEDLQVPDLTNVVLPAKNKEDFVALVLSANSTLQKTRTQLLAQKMSMITSQLNILPDLFATYSYNWANTPGWMRYNYDYFGVGVSWTINGRDNRWNGARKSYKNYRIADLNKSLVEKQIEADAVYSWDQYYAMLELVKATEKALKASSDSLKEVKVSVSTGTATFIDEMDIENQYLNANLSYLNAVKALTLAYYKLVSLTGVGYLPVV